MSVTPHNDVAAERRPNPLRELSIDDLRHRTSIKWQRYPQDVLPLWISEMDVLPARPVVEAVHEVLERGDTGYSTFGSEYADALDHFAAQRWGWRVLPERTRVVPGVMPGISEVLKVITDPGDGVVVNAPGYGSHFQFVEHLGRSVVEAPLDPDHRIDLEALRAAFEGAGGGRPRAYLLCSPHNPTGTVHTAEELTAVSKLAGAYGVQVVANEIHAPIVPAGANHVPYLSVPGTDNAICVISASKAWNLSGLKAGILVAGSASAADLERIPMDMVHGLSHVGVTANAAALRHGGDWLDGVLIGIDENRRLLAELLKHHLPGVRFRGLEGTYLAWLDCREVPELGDDPAAVFLERGRVALSPGTEFGTGGLGHARLNLATNPEILTEAVYRMAGSCS
jgi:cystathionine beta-lyase